MCLAGMVTLYLGAPSGAEAGPELMRRSVDRVRVRIDLPMGANATGVCFRKDEIERVDLRARVGRDLETGEVLRRGIRLTIDCIRIIEGEPEAFGGALYDSARLRRFALDPESGAITVRFVEHPGINTDTGQPSPVWSLDVMPETETEPAGYSLTNGCGGATIRDNETSSEGHAEGAVFGESIAFNELVDRARIDHWTTTGVCTW